MTTRRALLLVIAGAVLIVLMLGGSVAGAYALILHEVDQRQQVWCPPLGLLIKSRPGPAAPVADRRLYESFDGVWRRLGC